MAFTGDFSALLLLLAAAAMKTAWSERYPRETMSGGPLSDSPKCVSGFCLQKGYQEPYNELASGASERARPFLICPIFR